MHFALGYSHPVVFPIPTGIDVAVDKNTHITVTGADRQLVGQVAANMRRLRKPDPYKQKGIRYVGEVLKKKAGKAGATGSSSASASGCAAPANVRGSPCSAASPTSTSRW